MLYRIDFKAMGCQMIAMLDSPSPEASEFLLQVPDWFEGWEQTLSRFRKDSELNSLNRQAGWHVVVSQTIWDVFQAALAAEVESDGLVKATVLKALISAGYDRSFEQLPTDKPLINGSTWNVIPSLAEITLDESARSLCLPLDVQLDFGGVAKGWAADQAAKRLSQYGPALVSAGGDIAISDDLPNGELWQAQIEDPFAYDEAIANLGLPACGLATSGTDYRRWKLGGRWSHHIIDTRTGQSAQTDILSASVIAPNVLQAEMAAKTALILGSKAGMDWIEARPGFSAMFVLETSQEVLLSTHMHEYFWRNE